MKQLGDHVKALWQRLPVWLRLIIWGASGLAVSAVFTAVIIALAGQQNYLGIIAVALAFAMTASVFLVVLKNLGNRKRK